MFSVVCLSVCAQEAGSSSHPHIGTHPLLALAPPDLFKPCSFGDTSPLDLLARRAVGLRLKGLLVQHAIVMYNKTTRKLEEIINAILLGILDQKKGQYVNPRTGDTMLITDAISRGLIVADVKSTSVETDSAEDARILADRQTVYTLKSVIDPRSGRHISVSEVRSFINVLRVRLYWDESRSDITSRWFVEKH